MRGVATQSGSPTRCVRTIFRAVLDALGTLDRRRRVRGHHSAIAGSPEGTRSAPERKFESEWPDGCSHPLDVS